MSRAVRKLQKRVEALRAKIKTRPNRYARYRDDPIGFFKNVLRVTLTEQQESVVKLLLVPPYKVIVKSAHNVGKTFLAACIAIWWYFTRSPSVCITTAPTERDVIDLLWTEIRLLVQRGELPDHFIGPAAPEMGDGKEHYAKGYTARKGESFQGRHRPCMLFLFDEGEGIDAVYFTSTKTMFQPDGTHAWLVILNPTTNDSPAAMLEQQMGPDGQPAWHIVTLSALDHPNIAAELRGEKPPVPSAVSLAQVKEWIGDWCDPVPDGMQDPAIDFEFPPASGKWYRPNSIAEPRLLGRRPREGSEGCWSDALWEYAKQREPACVLAMPQIGCDVARYGGDFTSTHVRVGRTSTHHESVNGWGIDRTVGRLKELAGEWAAWYNENQERGMAPISAKQIPIIVDDDGVGGGVTDMLRADGYNAIAVNAATNAHRQDLYRRRRDELWFGAAAKARSGLMSLVLLSRDVQARLRQQLLTVKWKSAPDGRRVIEPKDVTKKNIGRSPDDADAFNLAYSDVVIREQPTMVHVKPEPPADAATSAKPVMSAALRTPDKRSRRHWPAHLR